MNEHPDDVIDKQVEQELMAKEDEAMDAKAIRKWQRFYTNTTAKLSKLSDDELTSLIFLASDEAKEREDGISYKFANEIGRRAWRVLPAEVPYAWEGEDANDD